MRFSHHCPKIFGDPLFRVNLGNFCGFWEFFSFLRKFSELSRGFLNWQFYTLDAFGLREGFGLFSPGAELDFSGICNFILRPNKIQQQHFLMVKIISGRTNLQILDLDGFLKI